MRERERSPAIQALNILCCWLQIQEAMLTGESVPVSKNTLAVPEKSGLGDRKCLAYSATAVSSGQGVGVVTATG